MTRESMVEKRIDALRKGMVQQDLNLIVISRPVNIFYFSDFNPLNYSMMSFILIPVQGNPILLLQAIRGPRAAQKSALRNIQLYGKWSDNKTVAMDPIDSIALLVREYGLGKLRVGGELTYLPQAIYVKLCTALGVHEMEDVGPLIDRQKAVKDPLTIDRIRKASALANTGITTLIAGLREGMTEIDACNAAKADMLRTWVEHFPEHDITGFGSADASIYDTLSATCTSGLRTSYGACEPIHVVPRPGELVLPIVTVKLGGYSVESERSLYVEALDTYRTHVFETVIEAREAVFAQICPGATFAQLFDAAAGIFVKRGFEEFLPGRVGHGIGLTNHESPNLAPDNDTPLCPGMIFTVEPGLMSAKFGGVRPSDTVLVTSDGYELLTDTENGMLKI